MKELKAVEILTLMQRVDDVSTRQIQKKEPLMKKIQYQIDGIEGKVDIVQDLVYALIACVVVGAFVYCGIRWGF